MYRRAILLGLILLLVLVLSLCPIHSRYPGGGDPSRSQDHACFSSYHLGTAFTAPLLCRELF